MRVLVCRPREDAEATARKLAAEGHEALVAPVLAIVALPMAPLARDVDALVVTSRHAVESLAPADMEGLLHRPVFAVGAATAAAARARGFKDVRIGAGDGSSLPDLLRLTLPARARLLYLAGRVRKPALPEALRMQGHALELRETYEARPCPWPEGIAAELAGCRLQACLHYSRRSAEGALEAAMQGGVGAPFKALLHACLSADVAAPLAAAGVVDIVLATTPEEASLLRILSARAA